METINGTIVNAVPAGSYESSHGLIYTTNVTVQTAQGQLTGELGSKVQLGVGIIGQQVVYEVKTTSHGVKFKKFNPPQSNQPPPAADRPYGQQPPPNQPGNPSSKEFCIMRQCAAKVVSTLNHTTLSQLFASDCERLLKYFTTSVLPPTQTEFEANYKAKDPAGGDPPPDTDDGPPPATDEDIPF